MKVHIIGLGLIGGSFALGLRRGFPEVEISGNDANKAHLLKAQKLKLIDRPAGLEEVEHADVVIIAVPVDVAKKVAVEVLDKVGANTLVFDAGSTKSGLCEAIEQHPNRRNFLA